MNSFIYTPGVTPGEFPHSEICGSQDVCSYPQLIAAYRVLHRRQLPRHPPYALCSLIVYFDSLDMIFNALQVLCLLPISHVYLHLAHTF